MSYSSLYILNKESVSGIDEMRNGWGSGPVVWTHLGLKYLPRQPVYPLGDKEYMNSVWALASDDSDLHDYERITLRFTFDRAALPLDKIDDAAQSFKQFYEDTQHMDHVNHWGRISETVASVKTMKLSRFARGIVLGCTSVCDPWEYGDQTWIKNAWNIYNQQDELWNNT